MEKLGSKTNDVARLTNSVIELKETMKRNEIEKFENDETRIALESKLHIAERDCRCLEKEKVSLNVN